MSAPAITHHVSLNLASLPGFGLIENPKAKHYAAAINKLELLWRDEMRMYPNSLKVQALDELRTTLRRIMWHHGFAA